MEQYFREPPGCHALFWALAKLNAKEMVSVGGDGQLIVYGGGRQRTSDGGCQQVKQYTVRSTSSETKHVCVCVCVCVCETDQTAWVQILFPPLTSPLTLGLLLSYTLSQFPHL